MYNRLVALGYKAVDICMDNLAGEVDKQIKKGVLSNTGMFIKPLAKEQS